MLKKDSLVGGSKSAMRVRCERRQARDTYSFISQLSCRHTARNAFMKNSLLFVETWAWDACVSTSISKFATFCLCFWCHDWTQPRKRLGSKANFPSTKRDTVNFAFVYHKVSKVHEHDRFYWTFWNNRSWMFKVNALHVFQNQGKYSITFHTRQLQSKH